jgi:hypothetical protein
MKLLLCNCQEIFPSKANQEEGFFPPLEQLDIDDRIVITCLPNLANSRGSGPPSAGGKWRNTRGDKTIKVKVNDYISLYTYLLTSSETRILLKVAMHPKLSKSVGVLLILKPSHHPRMMTGFNQ